MSAWLLEPVYWNWWVLGVALMVVEALLPWIVDLRPVLEPGVVGRGLA